VGGRTLQDAREAEIGCGFLPGRCGNSPSCGERIVDLGIVAPVDGNPTEDFDFIQESQESLACKPFRSWRLASGSNSTKRIRRPSEETQAARRTARLAQAADSTARG